MSKNAKSVLITGASQGFGLGAARALAERGHRVHASMRDVAGRNAAAAKELTEWAGKGGHDLHVVQLDVTSDESVARGVAQVIDRGPLDVVINNAGTGVMGIQETFTVEQVQALFNVNVFGVLRVNRAVLPHFRERGAGRLVFVSSGLGRLVFPFLGPYTATKFAVEALAQTAAYELAPLGIEAVILQPGAYGTGFGINSILPADQARAQTYGPVVAMAQGFGRAFEERAKAGQIGNPQEIVDAMVQLVEAPRGQVPARLTVGADVKEPVSAINQVSDQVQDRLLKLFGLR